MKRRVDEEVAYLCAQRLRRLATVDADGQPHVVPVGIDYDRAHTYVGGVDPEKTRTYSNAAAGNTKMALVVDDLVSTQPWTPRYVRVYGTAELVERSGQFGQARYLRITPTRSLSWNLEGRPFSHDREVMVERTILKPPASA
jgi:pyridoxamine 5'-phosphate oxidase family protein